MKLKKVTGEFFKILLQRNVLYLKQIQLYQICIILLMFHNQNNNRLSLSFIQRTETEHSPKYCNFVIHLKLFLLDWEFVCFRNEEHAVCAYL